MLTFVVNADTTSATDGSTPLGLQPGAPAGSYSLSGFDNVNLYNGSLSFQLALLSISGRGGARIPVLLPIEGKWRVLDLTIAQANGTFKHIYQPTQNWWENNDRKYRPGSLVARQGSFEETGCPDSTTIYAHTLTRLTFTAPDGTEYELRDQLTGGQPLGDGSCNSSPRSRGRVFVTSDGTAATFVSDTPIQDYVLAPNPTPEFYPSGYLMLRDGTRFRIQGGRVDSLRDRNGNKLSFGYDSNNRVTTITDSLNRVVTISRNTGPGTFDQITYKGFGGAPRSIKVNYSSLADALRSDFPNALTYKVLFPELNGSSSSYHNPSVVSSITLPNNQQYLIRYNPYGEVARVVLPTGGAVEYDYTGGGDAASGAWGADSMVVYRRVIERRIYPDGTTGSAYVMRMTYSRTEAECAGCVKVDQLNNAGALLSRSRHYFYGSAAMSFFVGPTEYSSWKEGREFQTDEYASDGTTVLRRTVHTWQQPLAGSSWPLTQAETIDTVKSNNPQITQIVTTLEPAQANKASKQTFGYDKYTNQTDVYEYDFGNAGPGSRIRHTHTDYLTSSYDTLNPDSTNPDLNQTSHIRNLATRVSIYDAPPSQAEVERARSVIEYDNYVLDGSNCEHSLHCPLLARANISGLDSLFGAGYTKRGNPTAVARYFLTNGSVTGSVLSYSQYDVAGNVVRVLDPRSTMSNNIATTIEYDDHFGSPDNEARSNSVPSELTGYTSFAFPTRVTNPLGHTTYAQFDYCLGQPVNGEDANGIVAAGYFSDLLDRPTQIRRGFGTGAENQTSFAYADDVRVITTSSDRDMFGDNLLVSKVLYDQMGRTIETRQYEGADNFIVAQTQYDALGRPFRTSNPFRPWQNESAVWTAQGFDALGRVISVTTADNAVVSTSYVGNSVTVTDQAGKSRKSVTDALGRLIEVYEDPGDLPKVNYQTTYQYDVLDDLVKVTQGVQQRFFMYDSLKRLIRARNPEQGTLSSLDLADPISGNNAWSVAYQYDANGNLTQKTDARGVLSTYTYDALNRNTTTDYSDTASITPDVKLFYDGAGYGVGRFWYSYRDGDLSVGSNVEHTAVDSYDALGKPLVQRQLFKLNGVWSPTYQVSRNYNRAGTVTSQTYPSGHTVSYTYDAAGRSSSFNGYLGDGANRTYASDILYSPFGGLSRERFGTNTALYHKSFYNIRGQLFDTRLSSVDDVWDWNRGRLILYYSSNHLWGQSGTDNNGNVRFAETWIPPVNATLDQADSVTEDSYEYDAVNRLTSVQEQRMTAAGGWVWQQQFRQQYGYDRYGNRTINGGQTWGTGINNKQFTVTATTNRLGVPAGQSGVMTYDPAGNLTNDTYAGYGGCVYDADNKMIAAQDSYGGWSYYTYDANGQRTRRRSNNQETWQIYGIDGELLAEYAANAAPSNPRKEYGYRNGQLLVTATPAQSPGLNVASAANGAVATASSTVSTFVASNAVNGDHVGTASWWADGTSNIWDDWIQVDFAGLKTINEVDVYGLQQNPSSPVEPTLAMTSSYALTDFRIEYWTSGGWVTVPGASVVGNNKVWNRFTFTPLTTTKIRVYVTRVAGDNRSQVVEMEAFAATEASIQWLIPDHLGTPRMIVDQTGSWSNVRRHDYLPFGEELFAGTGGRSAAQGYSGGDGIRQQFTSKERDNETGLYYVNARYYGSTQGRFTSQDPTLLSVNGFNPQTWNRYIYVLNNPLAYVDPLGLWALQSETTYKRDKDGNFERDGQGRLKVDRVVVTAVRTSDKDTGASLAKQLGLTGKSATNFAKGVGDGNNIRLSEQGGDIGRVFRTVEQGLKEQAKFEIEHPDRPNHGPDIADCSETACRIGFPERMFGTLNFSVQDADATIGEWGASTSVQESDLRLGDIIRWADARNNPKHFANFIFRNDDGVPVVFSKSGVGGPYETASITDGRWTKYGYGTITGIREGTGYYHPR